MASMQLNTMHCIMQTVKQNSLQYKIHTVVIIYLQMYFYFIKTSSDEMLLSYNYY